MQVLQNTIGGNMKNFIVFEGIDGSGKGTQLKMLEEYLKRTNQPAVFTREPGGGKISEEIRGVIKDKENVSMTDICELLLFEAARNQHLHDTILNNPNKLVICDRFTDSSLAYQGYGRGIDIDVVSKLNSIATEGISPVCTVFLDVPASIGENRNSRLIDKLDRIEMAGNTFMEKVYIGYKNIIKDNPSRFLVVDGTQNPDKVFEQILSGLKQRGIIK